jgi:transcription-repair coupling factor (superfamily II helicase)
MDEIKRYQNENQNPKPEFKLLFQSVEAVPTEYYINDMEVKLTLYHRIHNAIMKPVFLTEHCALKHLLQCI